MKSNIQLQGASSQTTRVYDASPSQVAKTGSVTKCKVFVIENYFEAKKPAPSNHKSIGDLIRKWEQNSARQAEIKEARKWVADTYYGELDTVRTLRLRKGWSQTQLAAELGTSQSHIARIERGTENVAIETCRKLCRALSVDMNTLDAALRNQENIADNKK